MTTHKAQATSIHETQAEYLRLKDLLKFLPFSASTIWRKSKSGEFCAPVKLSEGVTAWKTTDVRDWLDSKKAACDG
ncbi:MAG: AlpA family phage regulatory protein [Methylococcales bacterium]|nr:AlpA family phage regulatory protein [Methylococcales bacterium]